MASSATYEAVRSLLAGAFASYGYPILRWEDVDPDSEQGNAPWFAMEDSVSQELTVAIGTRCLRETGEILVHVFTPSSENMTRTRSLGDEVRKALRYQTVLTSAGWLETRNAGPPGVEITNFGRWSSMTVPVDYILDFVE